MDKISLIFKSLLRQPKILILGLMGLLVLGLVWSHISQTNQEQAQVAAQEMVAEAQFPLDSAVIFKQDDPDSAHKAFAGQIGRVLGSQVQTVEQKKIIAYQIQLADGSLLEAVAESELEAFVSDYKFGQTVGLNQGFYQRELGEIVAIKHFNGQNYYSVAFPSGGLRENLAATDLAYVLDIKLSEKNTGQENQAIIQAAMDEAEQHERTIINFPKGSYQIGSHKPDDHYVLLASNVELRGNKTSFVVAGSARWYGLATGPGATQGVSNFSMYGFEVVASDLKAGNQFIIMANHGQNWYVANNRFTMVHSRGSHVFDLGGLQNIYFENNQFIGYAPELTGLTAQGDYSLHDFYAEAIQLDGSNNKGIWDGGQLKKLDSNYMTNNSKGHVTQNFNLTDNQFLPYRDAGGKIIAHSASIGQHSSSVGQGSIQGNYFESSVTNLIEAQGGDSWLLAPIHFKTDAQVYQADNVIK